MKILKVFNNNVSLVFNESGQEEIVIGKGLGFGKLEGDSIDVARIEKRFILATSALSEGNLSLPSHINAEEIEIAISIIKNGEQALGYKIDEAIIPALADHISFALKRLREGVAVSSPLKWDIKQIYFNEYNYALQALEKIRETFSIELPEDEAVFITLHIVNGGSLENDMNETMKITQIINNILYIVKYHYQKEFNEQSYDYTRFVTHVRYYIMRNLKVRAIDKSQSSLEKLLTGHYKTDYLCAMKIKRYLESKYGWLVTRDDIVYLTLRLNRLSFAP
ncbi:PRD domain-containing protein [Klebsiella sp. BIGb0407]|uniref:PRD domain-containing protein n=1 Tax=Klebsiella sp. BIGb0407 TaxID=2940603 RepID=UPI00216891E4|nr:PRD domain-containing protein [Klebsiella sp. BIGb0407]MCS3432210.1 beta-glucoside operon transcriptional antiterminator [Klebsiella sp. BIGb0407]